MRNIILTLPETLSYAQREAFNNLRSNLMFSGPNIKTVLFTSCGPAEGKSTTSFYLAHSMASAEKRVLFIDADMRNSELLARFQARVLKQQKGLTHYLSGQADLDEIILQTNFDGLFFVPSGPLAPVPAELLAGERMENLLVEARKHFDTVIIDTPPVGMVIDAAVIAPRCDGVILVVEANSISRKVAIEAKKQLEVTGCRILGAVMTGRGSTGKYGKYGYGEYGKYGQYGE